MTNPQPPTPRSLLAAPCLGWLAGALLSWPALSLAQDDIDLSRLIFEVAEIPAEGAAATPGTAGASGNGAPGAGPARPPALIAAPVSDNPAADISAYRARISDTLANDNPYSAALREQYSSLGELLQQTDDHEEAIKAFESAMHIDRVNGGLYTLEQIPLVENIIESHTALGNFPEVNDFHGYLFYIQQRTYEEGDPRLLAAKEDWADWNVESFMKEGAMGGASPFFGGTASMSSRNDYVAVQNRDGTYTYVPRAQMMNVLGPNAAMSATITDLSMASAAYGVQAEAVIDERLRTARTQYEEIIENTDDEAADADAASNARVTHKLANVAYAVKGQLSEMDTIADTGSLYFNRVLQPRSTPMVVTRGYTRNREALEALAEKLEQDPEASAVQKAQAWIYVGDWHVGFDHATRSDDAYRHAWDLLNDAGLDAAAIDAVFMPQPLVPAPAFAIHKFSREMYGHGPDAEIAYKGYMDLTLNVSRYGDVRGVEIDAASPETSPILRGELLDYLRAQKVRPAVVNGETVEREDVKLRYYYSY